MASLHKQLKTIQSYCLRLLWYFDSVESIDFSSRNNRWVLLSELPTTYLIIFEISKTKTKFMPSTIFSRRDFLPEDILFKIFTYLTGEPGKRFSIRNYRTSLLNLFKADPSLFINIWHVPTFHTLVRNGIRDKIKKQLDKTPKPLTKRKLTNVYKKSRSLLSVYSKKQNMRYRQIYREHNTMVLL